MVSVDVNDDALFDAIQELDIEDVADALTERFEDLYVIIDYNERYRLINQIKTICDEFDITQEELFDEEDDEDEDEE